jgi:NTE family protein
VIIRKAYQVNQPTIPFRNQLIYIVDGGLLSNFPLWLFDHEEVKKTEGKQVPTLGFQLVGKHENNSQTHFRAIHHAKCVNRHHARSA